MNTTYNYIPVLSIAGFDGSGGAGIQADMKTFSALGCYATSVLTALPVQNTQGVRSIYPIPDVAVREQIQTILDDIFPKAIKIGMVHTSELVQIITDTLGLYPATPVVFDPVMVATSGHKLIEESTILTLVEQLFPITTVLTPNMDEAAILAEMEVKTLDDMYIAGEKILKLGCQSVLLKGGHLQTSMLTSLFFDQSGSVQTFEFEKFETNNTHGSGCTLSSAIASYLARGESLADAVRLGQDYVHQAILNGKDVQTGKGNGPLNHFFNPQKLIKHELV
ncbi:phosphomethylpyrimidine kinase [Sphingobacterium spiritivorum ATCC 33300]|uniref:hydroxymethylpyrimidine kinase n=1 Tax=Sphingobacterium spiritivorum ATCC 33300 TaxID=525372 RepID=C2FVP8_SPHSI|nr:bifunctional hydroxymethylpyrimidine kinase/phosphomethylpyrimidine kinase [Sphingobacterium spiritivorum]EEI93106.1 phosphomethylpyrimidine kinase [Sphingobacterium spiritivorum ATCC 33300]QQS96244.1 bifunctional hydroxymethylpyrimidine kinase/phosphomethylpyrimidine kinase [Sphingobacterium spiritivorum]